MPLGGAETSANWGKAPFGKPLKAVQDVPFKEHNRISVLKIISTDVLIYSICIN